MAIRSRCSSALKPTANSTMRRGSVRGSARAASKRVGQPGAPGAGGSAAMEGAPGRQRGVVVEQ